ncbi:hypothetical protein M0R72_05430 [Candidatus Pacearchaeota archaeon]|jgi:hypothetical protein|nr:hypothetical protein [Candidatus Pacearchaeota archaeon]
MDLQKFFCGTGLNVSKKDEPSIQKRYYLEPNNLYTLKEEIDYESQDFIYSNNTINETKFHKILLKEWFNFIKLKGNIIIKITNNKILSFDDLLQEINLLFGSKINFILKEQDDLGGIVILKKLKPSLEKEDFIDKWTFGIITDGSKQDILEDQIQSIIDLKIPFFEIIICGPYQSSKKRAFVKNIPFNEKIAWITKKKNLICKSAKYENLVITHNRFNFNENWYEGMKRYGNYFEVLTCKILDPLNRRAGDWLTYGRDLSDRWINDLGLLEYSDWDENGIINGSFYILKKSVWKKCPWDETRVWGMKEDDFLSLEFRDKGIVPRCNIFSIVHTFPEKYGEWHWKYKFNYRKLGKIQSDSLKKYILRKIDRLFRKYFEVGFVTKLNCNSYGW